MKTFISVKIALLPFAVFWLASSRQFPFARATAGALLAAAAVAYRARTRGPVLLEGVVLLFLSILTLLYSTSFADHEAHGAAGCGGSGRIEKL